MEHADSTRHHARTLRAAALAMLAFTGAGAQAEGLMLRGQEPNYGRSAPEYALTNYHVSSNSIRLFGDYYFFQPTPDNASSAPASLLGGFRASTGIVGLSQTATLYEARPESLQSLPYVGLGYSHLWFTGQLSLNADFGLASQTHGHGLFNSPSSLDEANTQLHWSPVMAVNVRYSF